MLFGCTSTSQPMNLCISLRICSFSLLSRPCSSLSELSPCPWSFARCVLDASLLVLLCYFDWVPKCRDYNRFISFISALLASRYWMNASWFFSFYMATCFSYATWETFLLLMMWSSTCVFLSLPSSFDWNGLGTALMAGFLWLNIYYSNSLCLWIGEIDGFSLLSSTIRLFDLFCSCLLRARRLKSPKLAVSRLIFWVSAKMLSSPCILFLWTLK